MFLRTLITMLVLATTLPACDKADNTNPEVADKNATVDSPPVIPRGSDILDEMDVTVQIEHPFVSEDAVRAAFTHSYDVLGISDPGVTNTGWKIIVADSNDMTSASTDMQVPFKSGRTLIAAPLYPFAGAHEATHFLMGEVTWNNWLPGYVMEFIAAQAEEMQPPGAKQDPYEILNRSILRMPFSTRTKNVDREGAIGVNSEGAYDGMRYALLRGIADKIGDDKARTLAHDVYALAAKNRRFTPVEELQPLFAQYGVGDCVLFQKGDKAGKYVDFFFNAEGLPVVVYKQIGDTGSESSFPGTLGITYKKNGAMAYGMSLQTNPMGVTTDDGGMLTAHWADSVDISVDGRTASYVITNTDGNYTAARVKKQSR